MRILLTRVLQVCHPGDTVVSRHTQGVAATPADRMHNGPEEAVACHSVNGYSEQIPLFSKVAPYVTRWRQLTALDRFMSARDGLRFHSP